METQSNIQLAKSEIETILVKYNVALVPTVVHQGDRTFSRIDVVETIPAQQQSEEDSQGNDTEQENG